MTRPPVPEGWEFRLSHDRREFAFYDPGNGPWFVPVAAMQGRFVDSVDMDARDWYRYLPAEVAAAEVLRIVAEWVTESNDVGGVDSGDLTWRLEQAGYPLPDEDPQR